jgi:L-rhamnonate dehydratase
VLVRVSDEDGLTGVGEADAPARIVRQLVEMDDLFEWSRSLRSIVVGLDPFELAANHARMLYGTHYHGRRGLGVHAVSAVDMALHDLAGKQLGRPSTSCSAVPAGSRCSRTPRSGPAARTDARSVR